MMHLDPKLDPHLVQERVQQLTRRHFFGRASTGVGVAALASLLNPGLLDAQDATDGRAIAGLPHHPPTARRVIFLFQSGGPSQVDLLDYKPELADRHGSEFPDSVRGGQRLTTMTSEQSERPIVAPLWKFSRHGRCGAEISELLPYTARVVDDLCIVRSLHTDAINHDPAVTLLLTGSQQPGRPSFGSWVTYGLGGENQNLPAFAVFISGGEPGDQPLNGRMWGAGFLPSEHQAVKFRGQGDPVPYLADPPGVTRAMRRNMLDGMSRLNALRRAVDGDPETDARIAQFELAYRMQTAAPELTSFADEPEHTLDLYGDDVRRPGTFAANCLLARRMAERGVRFIQLFHRGWDHHKEISQRLPKKCRQVDQPAAALVQDLKRRGLLNDTLVVWAGEFGRTVFSQGELAKGDFGRDHHPRAFSIWMAGGGVRAGTTVGRTDEFSYNVVDDPIHVHDLQATILHCLGIDHERLTYRRQGRDFRLTDVAGVVANKLLATVSNAVPG